MALLALVPAIVVLLVLMVAFVGITVDSTKWTQRRVDLFESRIAAETATQLAVEEIWTDWEDATAGLDVRVGTFRQFLQNYGIPSETGVANPVGVEILPRLGLPVDGQGETVIDGVVVEGVRVYRFDELRRTRLEFETSAVTGAAMAPRRPPTHAARSRTSSWWSRRPSRASTTRSSRTTSTA